MTRRRLRATLWKIRHFLIAVAVLASVASIHSAVAGLTPPSVEVVVASQPLLAGTTLRRSDVTVATVPQDFAPPSAFTSTEEVEGAVLTSTIPEGYPLGPSMLLSDEFLELAPEGTTILPIVVPENGMRSLLVPGQHISLYAAPSEYSEDHEAIEVLDDAVIVGIGEAPESFAFSSDSTNNVCLFIAVPRSSTNLVIGYGSAVSMRVAVVR